MNIFRSKRTGPPENVSLAKGYGNIGLGLATAENKNPQEALATDISTFISQSKRRPQLIVLWGALYHKLKHLKQFEVPEKEYSTAELQVLMNEQSDVAPFLAKLHLIYGNIRVVWFREVLNMKPSWATGFANTERYLVDLGSGQATIVDTQTGVQVPPFQYPFDFKTVKTADIANALLQQFGTLKLDRPAKVLATGSWRENIPKFEELQQELQQSGIEADLLTNSVEAQYGGQSIANVLLEMKKKLKFDLPKDVIAIESGKGSTQVALLQF